MSRTLPQSRRSRYGHEGLDGAELVFDAKHPQLAGPREADHEARVARHLGQAGPVGEGDDGPLGVGLHPAALGHPAADALGVDEAERLDVAPIAAHPQYAAQVIDL